MVGRGRMKTWSIMLVPALMFIIVGTAEAFDGNNRFPIKVRVPRWSMSDAAGIGIRSVDERGGWESAAGASRQEILCPSRDYTFSLGVRPFFANLYGSVKAESRGGEGTLLNLHGHLRLPNQNTLWEVYADLRMWDKITVRAEYLPWLWEGPGHAGTAGNFAGTLFTQDEPINSSLKISTLLVRADYDVSFSRDLVFGPNAEFQMIKWHQRVATELGGATDFNQTILQPTIGAHVRYEPMNTGYFSWFKPYLEGRFGWMSLNGLGLSTWEMAAGIAPPLSRNVDAGIKVGYKQWKVSGTRDRLLADVSVEGLFADFSLRF